MANDPVYVDGGERPAKKKVYYHTGLDIGGSEGLVQIVSAVDGLVVSAAGETLPEHRRDTPVSPRYDVVYLLDDRGWYYRNSHLKTIDPDIKPGVRVKQGQRLVLLARKVAVAAGPISTSKPRAVNRPANGARRRATPFSGRPILPSTNPG